MYIYHGRLQLLDQDFNMLSSNGGNSVSSSSRSRGISGCPPGAVIAFGAGLLLDSGVIPSGRKLNRTVEPWIPP